MQPQVKPNQGRQTEHNNPARNQAADVMEDARNVAAGVVSNIRDGASQLFERAQDVASDVAEKAQDYGGKAIDETTTLIKRYPAQSLLIGFGAGLLVGIVLARK